MLSECDGHPVPENQRVIRDLLLKEKRDLLVDFHITQQSAYLIWHTVGDEPPLPPEDLTSLVKESRDYVIEQLRLFTSLCKVTYSSCRRYLCLSLFRFSFTVLITETRR